MGRGLVVLDEDRCKACGLCVVVCPKHILELAENRFNAKGYAPIEVTDMDKCTACRHCAVVCPDVVFTIYRRKKQPRPAKTEPAEV